METSNYTSNDHDSNSTDNPEEINYLEETNTNTIEEVNRTVLDESDPEAIKVKIEYNNGDTYEGEVNINGLKEGWGLYLFKESDEKYEGFFQNGLIHGYGVYIFNGGQKYEGDWYEGMKQGVGILDFNNGEKYEGEFYKENFDGNGTYFYNNGDKFVGKWKNGKKNGDGSLNTKGRTIIGEWVEDELQHF